MSDDSNVSDVAVVGSGPNGLAAAVLFAAAGLSVTVVEAQSEPGGGVRTEELDLGVPLRHDLCSAVHPMAAASPFFRSFGLAERGVEFGFPDVSFAHPLDGTPAGIAYRSLDRTIEELGGSNSSDGRIWRRVMGPLVEAVESVRDIGLSDMRHPPASALTPKGLVAALTMAGRALELGTSVWDRVTDAHRCGAMLTGVGAHANTALPSLAGAGTALLLGSLAHAPGWPLPIGGSQVITDALVADLRARGATVVCDRPIESAAALPPARVYLFDTSAWTLAKVLGDLLAPRYRRALRSFRPGNGVAKVDFALSEPVPWADPRISAAGTVHLCGDRAQMKRSEADTTAGRHSERPMALLSQPTVVDATRIGAGGALPLWTYAHVPNGSTRDMTATMTAQIERFAPGFRDVIIGSRCIPAADMHDHNANYRGGDIAVGQVSLFRMAARPVAKWDPYRTSLPNVYLCSGATPPGPGVHGMSGVHAATRVLRQHFGIHSMPDIGPHRPESPTDRNCLPGV
ncbi:NAD(P)/FAD-dependent oxidoreductase [Mycobacterium sp. 852002-51961_SCH5331710]|uniref:phytoene desaturase family protein n=1 Tax=Mycobacterium sp. 852002-51961_SCH5331710 TaxID=1834105 RepID=UPI001E3E5252|nr:NAD(P)/FAD-dependent oxidoreductase [Mycobacterium sp. 852002-51961_SCH5331710]